MNSFLHENLLLTTDTARQLYHECAAHAPIIDYHCHVSPREICEDRQFQNITEVWLSGDHYKWRLMRASGVPEAFVSGNAPDRERFQKFAECLPRAIGNPMLHWCHLELKRFFGYDGVLNGDTADEVWELTASALRNGLSVRKMIARSNVAFIGTTDDPADSLEWHARLAQDNSFATEVAPSFRPDRALNVDQEGWCAYIRKLSEICGFEIDRTEALRRALSDRIAYFASHGCRSADHGLERAVFSEATDAELDEIFARRMRGEAVSLEDGDKFRSAFLIFCASEYASRNIVLQIHYNCLRNPNRTELIRLGKDSGFDCVGQGSGLPLARLLDRLYATGNLPKTVLYSLNAGDDAFLDSLCGAFSGEGIRGRVQHGSAWWFNDHIDGMRRQLTSLASISTLGNFIGMLTDSRSFLSYPRHEYFRRILCDLVGGWVERGEYPNDSETLHTLIRDICCDNAARFFQVEV